MTWLVAVLATLALGLLLAFALSQPGSASPRASARWWVLLHHGVVALGAAATVLALVLPPELLGGQRQSGIWGGYLGQLGVLGFFAVLTVLPLTLLLRAVLRRVAGRREQAVCVGAVWALTLLIGAAVAIVILA